MSLTERMLIGAIANNPASFGGAGEYRCCRTCEAIFFTSAKQHDAKHDVAHRGGQATVRQGGDEGHYEESTDRARGQEHGEPAATEQLDQEGGAHGGDRHADAEDT